MSALYASDQRLAVIIMHSQSNRPRRGGVAEHSALVALRVCRDGDVRYCTVPISIVGLIMDPSSASESPQQVYEQAIGFHQQGNLVEAERLYLQVLSADASSF